MPETYPIVQVRKEWVLEQEVMGSKEKFWYLPEGQTTKWLFKYPREDTGEHWAEKVAAEVAGWLGIPHGRVELAVFEGRRGSVTKSFVSEGEELVHGNQVLAGTVGNYDPTATFRHSDHTLENIWRGLDSIFEAKEAAREAKLQFAEYLVLDALIGNVDRHHENWGLIRERAEDGWRESLAPSFDHATSLGRELSDEKRDGRLTENRVAEYVEKGRGAIYWSPENTRAPSPLRLVHLAFNSYPDLLLSVVENLDRLDELSVSEYVYRVPDCWMSNSARDFAVALMRYNLEQFRGLIQ